MMEEKTISKNTEIRNDKIVISRNIELSLDTRQAEVRVRDIQARMDGLRARNNDIVKEYNGLLEEKTEIENLIVELQNDEEEPETIK